MRILIDNQDGLGSLDYTAAVCFSRSEGITRRLNEITLLRMIMTPKLCGLKIPVNGAAMQAPDSTGRMLFTGFVMLVSPEEAGGADSNGATCTVRVEAASDEIALDSGAVLLQTTLLGESVEDAWNQIAALSSGQMPGIFLNGNVSVPSRVPVRPGERWSTLARVLGDTSRIAYSALSGQVTLTPVGNVVHSLSADTPGLTYTESNANGFLRTAGDITVCGKAEADAYVTELFAADGVTAAYKTTLKPFVPEVSERVSIQDLFQGTSLNTRLWSVTDSGLNLSLGAAGLTCSGGTGRDAGSTVASMQQIELGGALTLEAGAVVLEQGSSGSIVGLYAGSVSTSNCIAAFAVSSSSSGVSVSPMVNGGLAGASFAPLAGAVYTYRLRVYSPEVQRIQQTYFYQADGMSSSLGGSTVPSIGMIEFEVQQIVAGVPAASTVLYSGSVAFLPPAATIGLLDSGALNCSIRSFSCVQTLPVWVQVGALGSQAPQFSGVSTEGGACAISDEGRISFYPANVPVAGAVISVAYRTSQQAVARRATANSGSATAAPAAWVGSVNSPAPLSSVDCDSAAAALLSMALQMSSRLQGSYTVVQLEGGTDIWPGDVLSISDAATGQQYAAIVRTVQVTSSGSVPTTLEYHVGFANDWAEQLSIRTTEEVPQGVRIPQAVMTTPVALQSLTALTVQTVTGSTITLTTGCSAPVNGGFEIRRRDATFGPGTDSDLVLRSAATTITLPRSAAVEQFYLRMYDSAQPPNYSLHSAAIFINIPL